MNVEGNEQGERAHFRCELTTDHRYGTIGGASCLTS
jgi:hypothetical protein